MHSDTETEFIFRRLDIGDAERLTEMYSSVEINKENYLEKVSDKDTSFAKKGGMFIINDYEKNCEILSSKDDILFGAEQDGIMYGMIWYNPKDMKYPFGEISYFDKCAEYKTLIEKQLEIGKLYLGKEVIVMPEAKGKLAYSLFDALLKSGESNGYDYMLGEVYRLNGYEDKTGFHECDLLNMPSYMTLKKTGGVHIGTAPQRIIRKDGGITFYITPQVFIWNVHNSFMKKLHK